MKMANRFFLLIYFVLVSIGLLMIYSASSDYAQATAGSSYLYFRNQAIYALLSIALLFFMAKIKKEYLVKSSVLKIVMFVMFLLLSLVLLTGQINGASRWISIGSFNIQPGEIAKIIMIWYTAFILSKKQKKIATRNMEVFPPLVVCLLTGILLFLQPDVGSILILVGIILAQIFASGIPIYVGALCSIVISAFISGYLFLINLYGTAVIGMSPYRFDRFTAFWSPFELENEAGHQLVNSYYALSRGGVFGVGLGKSVQKSGYLPEPHTDFILAIIGEELGLIGVIVVLTLLFSLILWLFYLGVRLNSSFASLCCIGVGTLLLVQSCINIGGVVGLLPISGVPLPFISYGGSNLLISSLGIGLCLNVSDTFRSEKKIDKFSSVSQATK